MSKENITDELEWIEIYLSVETSRKKITALLNRKAELQRMKQ